MQQLEEGEEYLKNENLLEVLHTCEEQAASRTPMVMSFHILQQKSPKKEKVGVKGTALLSCSKTPMLDIVLLRAQPVPSLIFHTAAPSLNAVLCHDFPFDFSSKAAAC